ncbi:unnamed protein product [Paramecium sonneborni]|uniref:Transmembrane protein n=1 Tax=Paramecium sonneborni TaxID=65129 RepID=A0A8S1NX11_9CILI|nr:unnamed protein product [Paramecium sonneborni]
MLIFSILILIEFTQTIHNFYQNDNIFYNQQIQYISSLFCCIFNFLGNSQFIKRNGILPNICNLKFYLQQFQRLGKQKRLMIIQAALQILITPVRLGFQAQYIRNYQNQQENKLRNCQQLMNNLSESFYFNILVLLITQKIQTSKCLDGNQESTISSTQCDNYKIVQRWEVESSADHPFGCLNLIFCETVSNILTKDLLILIIFSLSTPLFLFSFNLFEFNFSTITISDKTLSRNIENCFYCDLLVLFEYETIKFLNCVVRKENKFAL